MTSSADQPDAAPSPKLQIGGVYRSIGPADAQASVRVISYDGERGLYAVENITKGATTAVISDAAVTMWLLDRASSDA